MKLCILVYFCISPRTPAYTHVSFIFDAYDKYSFPSHAHHPCIPQYILVMLFFRPHVCMIGYSYLIYIYILYIFKCTSVPHRSQDSGTLSGFPREFPGFTLGFKLPQRPHLDRQNISQRIYQRILATVM